MTVLPTPWMRPLRAPFSEVTLSPLDGAVYRWTPMSHHLKATRLAIPANWAGAFLKGWNQKYLGEVGSAGGSPWKGQNQTNAIDGKIAQLLINTGTSAFLHREDYGDASAYFTPLAWNGKFNWNHNKASDFYRYDFYLDNDLEETDPTVLYDDDESFWDYNSWGSGSYDVAISEETTIKAKGTSSLKFNSIAGTKSTISIEHIWGSGQDWSAKEFLCFYWYGQNSGEQINFEIHGPMGGSDYRWNYFVDNFTGWKRFVFPFSAMNVEGSPDIAAVRQIMFYCSLDGARTWYIDRMVLDVGQWVRVEAYVPDSLRVGDADGGSGIYSCSLSFWDWNQWNQRTRWSVDAARGWSGYQGCPIFLGDVQLIYNPDYQGVIPYVWGERGESKSVLWTFGGPETPITYSLYYGCQKRIGFAVKMPPDDLQDSSTAGISQCKLRLEVYYADSGRTTYEFANSTNQYYGLQNMNESWLVAFDLTAKRVEYLILSQCPTGLSIRADENELIDRVDLTLAKGTRVFAGELVWGDLTRDSDGDTVPDFLSGGKPTNEVTPTVLYEDDETAWMVFNAGSGSYQATLSEETTIKASGASALQCVIGSGSYANCGMVLHFSSAQDWSAKKFIGFWWYGATSGATWVIEIFAPDWTNRLSYDLVDNWTGWKRVLLAFNGDFTWNGSPDLTNVNDWKIICWTIPAQTTVYVDRTVIDTESPIGIPYLLSKMFQEGYP